MNKKTLVESSLGFKTTEETARYLDGLLKSLPKDSAYAYRKKNASAEISFEPGERASVDVISTDRVDHQKEVIVADGMNLDCYRKNPIVLYSHDQEKPIGKSLWIKATPNGIKSKTLYANRPTDYEGDFLPDLVFALVRQAILKGRSIGFLPVELDAPTQEQVKARPDWQDAEIIISKSELFEYSVVAVPCNEDALQQIVSKQLKGMTVKSLKALGLPIKALPTINENELLLTMLDRISLNPEAITKRVIKALEERGKV